MRFRTNNVFLAVTLLVCAPFWAGGQSLTSLDDAAQDGARYLQGRFPKGTRAALVAVSSENQELGEYVLKKLGTVLVNGGWFTVVERNAAALASIDKEMERHLNFYVSEETGLSIGKQLGAEIIISGSFNRAAGNWRLDVQAITVEGAQRAGQWASDVRSDPAWASFAPLRSAALVFDGDVLATREKQTITAGMRNAMQAWNTALELNENAQSGGYAFTVTIYRDRTNNGLLRTEATAAFSHNGRVLCQTGPYYITETTDALIARRVGERLKEDWTFFNKVNEVIR
jgi:hypothetical protein